MAPVSDQHVIQQITGDVVEPPPPSHRQVIDPPYMGLALIVWIAVDVAIVVWVWWRAQFAAAGKLTGYGFGDPQNFALGGSTIGVTALVCFIIAATGKVLIRDWVNNVRFTPAAIKHGVEDDDEFLHLCVMSYITIIVFAICGPAQFVLSLMVMFSKDSRVWTDPTVMIEDVEYRTVVAMVV